MIEVKRITTEDDLDAVVGEINAATWDAGNEMVEYKTEGLATYLRRQDTVFVTCHMVSSERSVFMGMASCRIEMKPYTAELWLYVDEVDVCADQRQKGAGTAIMQKLLQIADQEDCEEVWLGTEVDNDAANALYKSLNPDDIAKVVGYTWEL